MKTVYVTVPNFEQLRNYLHKNTLSYQRFSENLIETRLFWADNV